VYIKMIVTDLDGTLLRDDKTTSWRNIEALAKCRERGVKVVFATGRGYRSKVVPPEWFDGWVRTNGAYACAGETVVYQRAILRETSRSIVAACEKQGMNVEPREDEDILILDMKPGDAEFIHSVLPDDLYLIVLRDSFGQIMHKDATKSNGAAALAAHWGIAREEVAAFGDDLNDIDLLQWAGTGVAMANALEVVKTAADTVTLSNEEDGFAVWIEGNVL
jgi:hypothetical protein